MKQFVVAICDCFECKVSIQKVEAEDVCKALCLVLGLNPEWIPADITYSVEGLMKYAEESDTPINFLEL